MSARREEISKKFFKAEIVSMLKNFCIHPREATSETFFKASGFRKVLSLINELWISLQTGW